MAAATIVSLEMRGGVAKGKTTDIIEELLNTFRRVDLLLPDCIFNPTKIHAHILTYTLRYKHTHTHTYRHTLIHLHRETFQSRGWLMFNL